MSLFSNNSPLAGLSFSVFGGPGSGKTTFALKAKLATGKRVAYIGSDNGAKTYLHHPEFGGFAFLETRDPEKTQAAVDEILSGAWKNFGAVVGDTVTDWWEAVQQRAMRPCKDGSLVVPKNAWTKIKQEHDAKLRDLTALPIYSFFLYEEKEIMEERGDQLVRVGVREESNKKDGHVPDVRLRFGVKAGKYLAEVYKDRLGLFAQGSLIENPTPEPWILEWEKRRAAGVK